MKKRNDGQVSLAAESDEDIYKALKPLCTRGIELGYDYWNWPLVGYLTVPSLQRILNLAWIYEMQKSSSGSILVFDEFNCPHFPGETAAVMEALDFKDFEFIQSPYLPFNSVCKFGN